MVITLCELRLAEVKDHGQRLTREWQMRKSNLRLPSPKLLCPSKVYATELHCAQLHPAGTCLLHKPSLLLRRMCSLGFLLGCPDSVPGQGWREGEKAVLEERERERDCWLETKNLKPPVKTSLNKNDQSSVLHQESRQIFFFSSTEKWNCHWGFSPGKRRQRQTFSRVSVLPSSPCRIQVPIVPETDM